MKISYRCDYCGVNFDRQEDCLTHEKAHKKEHFREDLIEIAGLLEIMAGIYPFTYEECLEEMSKISRVQRAEVRDKIFGKFEKQICKQDGYSIKATNVKFNKDLFDKLIRGSTFTKDTEDNSLSAVLKKFNI